MDFFFPATSELWLCYETPEQSQKPRIIDWIERISGELSRNAEDADARQSLEDICKLVISRTKLWKARTPAVQSRFSRDIPPPFSDHVLSRVIAACFYIDEQDLFLEAFYICPANASPLALQSIGAALLRYDLRNLLPV